MTEDKAPEATTVYCTLHRPVMVAQPGSGGAIRIIHTATSRRRRSKSDAGSSTKRLSGSASDLQLGSDSESSTQIDHEAIIGPKTKICYIYNKAKVVFMLDMTPSLASVDPVNRRVYLESLFVAIERLLRVVKPAVEVSDSGAEVKSQVHVSIVAYISAMDPAKVIINGAILTAENADSLLAYVSQKIFSFCRERDGVKAARQNIDDDPDIVPVLENGLFALERLSSDALPSLVFITDGVMGASDTHTFDNILTRMNRADVTLTTILVGQEGRFDQPFGYCVDAEILRFVSEATFGKLITLEDLMQMKHDEGPLIAGGTTLKLRRIQQYVMCRYTCMEQPVRTGGPRGGGLLGGVKSLMLPGVGSGDNVIDHAYPWQGEAPSPEFHRESWKKYSKNDFRRCLELRVREGFKPVRTAATLEGSQEKISITLMLQWQCDVYIEYTLEAPWSFNRGRAPSTGSRGSRGGGGGADGGGGYVNVTVQVVAHWHFMRTFRGLMQQKSSSNFQGAPQVSRLLKFLSDLEDTDNLLNHLNSSEPPPDPYRGTGSSTQKQQTPTSLIWTVVADLRKNVWERWFKVERLEVYLACDDDQDTEEAQKALVKYFENNFTFPISKTSFVRMLSGPGGAEVGGGDLRGSIGSYNDNSPYSPAIPFSPESSGSGSVLGATPSGGKRDTSELSSFLLASLSWETANLAVIHLGFFSVPPAVQHMVFSKIATDISASPVWSPFSRIMVTPFVVPLKPISPLLVRRTEFAQKMLLLQQQQQEHLGLHRMSSPHHGMGKDMRRKDDATTNFGVTSFLLKKRRVWIVDDEIMKLSIVRLIEESRRRDNFMFLDCLRHHAYVKEVPVVQVAQRPRSGSIMDERRKDTTALLQYVVQIEGKSNQVVTELWVEPRSPLGHSEDDPSVEILGKYENEVFEELDRWFYNIDRHLASAVVTFFSIQRANGLELEGYGGEAKTTTLVNTNRSFVPESVTRVPLSLINLLPSGTEVRISLPLLENAEVDHLPPLEGESPEVKSEEARSAGESGEHDAEEAAAVDGGAGGDDEGKSGASSAETTAPGEEMTGLRDLNERKNKAMMSPSKVRAGSVLDTLNVMLYKCMDHMIGSITDCQVPLGDDFTTSPFSERVPRLAKGNPSQLRCYGKRINDGTIALLFLRSSESIGEGGSAGEELPLDGNLLVDAFECTPAAIAPPASHTKVGRIIRGMVGLSESTIIDHADASAVKRPIEPATEHFFWIIEKLQYRNFVRGVYYSLRVLQTQVSLPDLKLAMKKCSEFPMVMDVAVLGRVSTRQRAERARAGTTKAALSETRSIEMEFQDRFTEVINTHFKPLPGFSSVYYFDPQPNSEYFKAIVDTVNSSNAEAASSESPEPHPASHPSPDHWNPDADSFPTPRVDQPEDQFKLHLPFLDRPYPDLLVSGTFGDIPLPFFMKVEAKLSVADEPAMKRPSIAKPAPAGPRKPPQEPTLKITCIGLPPFANDTHDGDDVSTIYYESPPLGPSGPAQSARAGMNAGPQQQGSQGPGADNARVSDPLTTSGQVLEITELPKLHQEVMNAVCARGRSILAEVVLDEFLRTRGVTDAGSLGIVMEQIDRVSPQHCSRITITLGAVDLEEGRRLYPDEIESARGLGLMRIGSSYVSHGVEDDAEELDVDSAVPRYLLLLSINNDDLVVCLYSRSLESHIRDRIMDRVRSSVTDVMGRVNRLILLNQLHETKMCHPILIPPLSGPAQKFAPRGTNSQSSDTEMSKHGPGSLACPCVYTIKLPLHERLTPEVATQQLAGTILNAFLVNNHPNVFVTRENNGNVFYMRLQAGNVDADDDTSPFQDVKVGPGLPIGKQISPPAMRSGTPGSDAGRNGLILRVFGVDEPTTDITERLKAMVETKLSAVTLSIMSTLLARNKVFKLAPSDVTFVRPDKSLPARSVITALPWSILDDPYTFLQYLNQNLTQYLNPLYLMGLADGSKRGSGTLRKQYSGKISPSSGVVTATQTPESLTPTAEIEALNKGEVEGGGGEEHKVPTIPLTELVSHPTAKEFSISQELCFIYNSTPPTMYSARAQSYRQMVEEIGKGIAFVSLKIVDKYGATQSESPAPSGDDEGYASEGAAGTQAPHGPVPLSPSKAKDKEEKQPQRKSKCKYQQMVSAWGTLSTESVSFSPSEDFAWGDPNVDESSRFLVVEIWCKGIPGKGSVCDGKLMDRVGLSVNQTICEYALDTCFLARPVSLRRVHHNIHVPCQNALDCLVGLMAPSVHRIETVLDVPNHAFDTVLTDIREVITSLIPALHPVVLAGDKARFRPICTMDSKNVVSMNSRRVGVQSETQYSVLGGALSQMMKNCEYCFPDREPLDRQFMDALGIDSEGAIEDLLQVHSHYSQPCNKARLFYEHIPCDASGHRKSSHIYRKCFAMLLIRDRSLTVYLYNWASNLIDEFNAAIARIHSWNGYRTDILQLILEQKMGVFSHTSNEIRARPLPEGIRPGSLANLSLPFNLESLDSLIDHPSPLPNFADKAGISHPKPPAPKTRRESESKEFLDYSYQLDLRGVLRGVYPSLESGCHGHLAQFTGGDPLLFHGKQFKAMAEHRRKMFEKKRIFRDIATKWEMNLQAPPIEYMSQIVKASRLLHFKRSPLMFNSLRDSLFANDVFEFSKIPIEQINMFADITNDDEEATRREVMVYGRLLQSFLQTFCDYLMGLGLTLVAVVDDDREHEAEDEETSSTPSSLRTGSKAANAPLIRYEGRVISLKSTKVYLQKVIGSTPIMLEVGFVGIYVACNMYVGDLLNALTDVIRTETVEPTPRTRSHSQATLMTQDIAVLQNQLHLSSFVYDFHCRHIMSYCQDSNMEYPDFSFGEVLGAVGRYYVRPPSFSRNQLQTFTICVRLQFQVSADTFFLFLSESASKFWCEPLHHRNIHKMVFIPNVILKSNASSRSVIILGPGSQHDKIFKTVTPRGSDSPNTISGNHKVYIRVSLVSVSTDTSPYTDRCYRRGGSHSDLQSAAAAGTADPETAAFAEIEQQVMDTVFGAISHYHRDKVWGNIVKSCSDTLNDSFNENTGSQANANVGEGLEGAAQAHNAAGDSACSFLDGVVEVASSVTEPEFLALRRLSHVRSLIDVDPSLKLVQDTVQDWTVVFVHLQSVYGERVYFIQGVQRKYFLILSNRDTDVLLCMNWSPEEGNQSFNMEIMRRTARGDRADDAMRDLTGEVVNSIIHCMWRVSLLQCK